MMRKLIFAWALVLASIGPAAATTYVYEAETEGMVGAFCAYDVTQRMGFSLEEIGQLLRFREDPQNAQTMVRQMAQEKLVEIEETLKELNTLRDEFRLLINLCMGSEDGCPILEELE